MIRDGTGRIDAVRSDELPPMLLNEVQQRQRKMTTQEEKHAAQDEHIAAQAAESRDLKRQQLARLTMLNPAAQAALRNLQAKEEFSARRCGQQIEVNKANENERRATTVR
jgi:hypothetical protein